MRTGSANGKRIEEATHYLHGRIERELELFAAAIGCFAGELTSRVGALLLGVGPGSENFVSAVRPKTTGTYSGVEQMEMADGAYRGKARRSLSERNQQLKLARVSSWAKFKTKSARSKEMARRRLKAGLKRKELAAHDAAVAAKKENAA